MAKNLVARLRRSCSLAYPLWAHHQICDALQVPRVWKATAIEDAEFHCVLRLLADFFSILHNRCVVVNVATRLAKYRGRCGLLKPRAGHCTSSWSNAFTQFRWFLFRAQVFFPTVFPGSKQEKLLFTVSCRAFSASQYVSSP